MSQRLSIVADILRGNAPVIISAIAAAMPAGDIAQSEAAEIAKVIDG